MEPIHHMCKSGSIISLKTELRSCVKVEVTVQGFPSLIILMVYNSVDVNNTEPVLVSELRSCVKVEVAVLGSRP